MNEKNKPTPIMVMKPVPMKLFATWEVDRTPPNCIPRLCSLTLTRLILLKSLGPDVSSIVIAVKIQGSKRTLRSNEIILSPNDLFETELQLIFSLQYPHFLKRDGNRLHVMLQRRKRYKNRTILGYKTLAEGIINMSQVLQRQIEMELDLLGDCKESKGHNMVIGRVSVSALTSQPVDHEDNSKSSDRTVADFSDEDEEFSSGNDDGEVEGSDSEPIVEDRRGGRKSKINGNVRQRNLKQKFISLLKRFRVNEELQSLDNDQETISRKLSGGDMDGVDIDDLLGELEDLSDSEPEMDTMSISSTPKPSLRPFFSSSGSLLHDGLNVPGWLLHKKNCHTKSMSSAHTHNKFHTDRTLERISDESSKRADSDSHPENWTDSDPPPPNTSPPRNMEDKKESALFEKDRRSKLFNRDRNNSSASKSKKILLQQQNSSQQESPGDMLSPSQNPFQTDINQLDNRKYVEQLNRLFPLDDHIPDTICLISIMDHLGNNLANKLFDKRYKVITVASFAVARTVISCLVNKMQKFCNVSSKPPSQIKLLLAGSDSFINTILKHYIDQHSYKSPDWTMYIKFFIVPLGSSYLCRYLGSIDTTYNSLFASDSWRECLERTDNDEVIFRIHRYLQQASSSINLPIAEAMLTLKGNNSNEESSQVFIPFVIDVRLGSNLDVSNTNSIDNVINDESQMVSPVTVPSSNTLSTSSPPSNVTDKKIDRNTPPNSPNINSHNTIITSQFNNKESNEPLELQLDYWSICPKNSDIKNELTGKKNESGKSTLKTAFKSIQIARLSLGDAPTAHFSINYTTKEKKQKIMRLGKKKEKEKESDHKNQVIDGVFRLICSPRTQNVPLIVNIDGNEWTGVKFFQLSAQWQTHVRFFSVTVFNNPMNNTAYSS